NLGAQFTNVPGGTASWSFTASGNYYDQTGTAAVTIGKANATISVTAYSVIYDGAAHTATGTAKGVKGESLSGLNLSGTTHTNANTAPTPAGSVQFVIDGVNFGAAVALDGTGHATSGSTSSLSGGGHTVTASYLNAGGNFSNSSGSFTQTVGTPVKIDGGGAL